MTYSILNVFKSRYSNVCLITPIIELALLTFSLIYLSKDAICYQLIMIQRFSMIFYQHTPSYTTYYNKTIKIQRRIATSGAGTAYPSGAHEFTPAFSGVHATRSLVLCVCFVDRCLSLFFWPECCLSY
jgi:hypothetical protein